LDTFQQNSVQSFLLWVVGGQAKYGEVIFGEGLVLRCERSKHGKTNLANCRSRIFIFFK